MNLKRLATFLLMSFAALPPGQAHAQADSQAQALPQPHFGRIERLADLPSRHVAARNVDVWLPEGYEQAVAAGRRFQVLYMSDGQMLFDARTTWNHQAWNVDVALTHLMRQGRIPDTMVVGVWNNGAYRHSEYFPQKFLPLMRPEARDALIAKDLQNQPQSDAYLRFLVEELKPAIDARYATRPDAAHTALMGSSMGGLISVYAMNEYPQVFGGAAGLSTHWIGDFQPNADRPLAAFLYLRDHLADPASHRLYQDHGTEGLDALYAPYQVFVDQIARDRGYTERGAEGNYLSLVIPGAGHEEVAWAARLETPLIFLLGWR